MMDAVVYVHVCPHACRHGDGCTFPTGHKVDQLQDGLVQLLDFTRQVQAVNTEGVEPLHTVLDGAMPLRPDVAKEQGNILGNAPQEFERFFVAPLEKHFDGAEE